MHHHPDQPSHWTNIMNSVDIVRNIHLQPSEVMVSFEIKLLFMKVLACKGSVTLVLNCIIHTNMWHTCQ